MNTISLACETENGDTLTASFLPEKGMTLASYKLGDIEVIDQSTKESFERRFAGLGPLIGPHFHRRAPHLIPKTVDYSLFPHAPFNPEDPFSHGIARYAPWRVHTSGHAFFAELSGNDTWHGYPLSEIEGQRFEMKFNGQLTKEGLDLQLSVVSDTDSLVGIHYYYRLENGQGTVHAKVQNRYIVNNEERPLPAEWNSGQDHNLVFPLNQECDYTFFPFPNPLQGTITLETASHRLVTEYHSNSQELSWQLWHPKDSSFVCIEPVSSQNPRRPNLTVSSIRIRLKIEDK